MAKLDRIIILVDMDCFYCQVEEKLDPSLEGKPIAVVQYNAWRGGGIIAVNYLAREKGVTRHMRGAEAKEKCPDIILARVPELRGKADLTKYRDAGKRVADVLQKYTPLLERASVDEAYLDITNAVNKWIEDNNDFDISIENLQNTYTVGYDIKDFLYNIKQNREYCETNYKLAVGGLIAEEIRADVLEQTGYKCSAGIAHNKILAKLVCGLHKPNKQTLLPQESIPIVYKDLPIKKIKSLGGKFGNALSEKLKITHMGELIQFSEKDLLKKFDEKTAKWLYNIARGIDLEPVTTRLVSKSIGCCKNFPGKTALRTPESVEHWLNEFAAEIFERIEKDLKENNRKAKQIVVNFAQEINGKEISSSKSLPLNFYDQFKIAQTCLEAIRKLCLKPDGTYNIKFLGISVGNFEDNKKTIDIATYFKNIQDNRKIPILKRKLEDTSFAAPVLKENNTLVSVPALLNQCKMPIIYDESNVLKEESSNDEGGYDDENSSIYSAATEELNEDQKGLIYYEDIYPESVASQPIFRDKSRGSTNVIYLGNNINKDTNSDNPSANKDNIEIPSSSSFFTKYFENCNFSDDSNISPVKRNFDTSKILEENSVDSPVENIDYNEISPYENIENNNQIDSIQQKQYDEIDTETDLDYDHNVECPECNKKILQSQLVSHMDYHFALKIVREESHLYKSTPTPKILKTENPLRQNLKKKAVIETEPILTFFKKGELNVENSEVCSECHKRIKLEDIDNHFDYHAAKRLHLEINSHGSSGTSKTDYKSPNKNQIKKSKGIIKRKKPNSNVKDISTFFKSA